MARGIAAQGAGAPRLVVRGARKAFGATVALAGVDLEARAGEVHAILGQNGAGKSTLMGVLGGDVAADAGALTLDGAPYAPETPRDAHARGVAMVHQELRLCPDLTVAENVMLGREPARFGVVNVRELTARAGAALLAAAGEARAQRIPLGARVVDLALADRQLVEIARALADPDCRVLILDEPTSSLGRDEVRVLFDRIRSLRERGMCVLYISHFLEEVAEIADRYTVLRDGRTVGTGNVADLPAPELMTHLVTLMAGKPVAQRFPRSARELGDVILACDEVAGRARPTRASFELRAGEVLGIAGVVGSGRTELLRVIFGLDPLAGGHVRVKGREGGATPADRIAHGVGMLSEDRKGEGLAVTMSIADNLTLSKLRPVIRASTQRQVAALVAMALRVRHRDVDQAVSDLSGGNQQKVALGRLILQDAEIILLDQPTRGVDVAAKGSLHRVIDAMARKGRAIVLVSDDLAELLGMCDRIAVMRRGVLGDARPVSAWTENALLAEAVGAAPTPVTEATAP